MLEEIPGNSQQENCLAAETYIELCASLAGEIFNLKVRIETLATDKVIGDYFNIDNPDSSLYTDMGQDLFNIVLDNVENLLTLHGVKKCE